MAVSPEILPWHAQQWARVEAWLGSGRLPHAILLGGPAGLGKTVFADRLAAVLLCAGPRPSATPCGACTSCRLLAAGTHPDLLRIEPAEAGKPIRVDQVRELGSALSLRSGQGGRRVAVLAPAEAMNRQAANALLKTLEEPPGEAVLLLVAHTLAHLPATIRSRCQRVAFLPPSPPAARAWLAARVGDTEDVDTLLRLAGGAPLAAAELAGADALTAYRALRSAVQELMRDEVDPIEVAERWRVRGAGEVCRWSYRIARDLVAPAAVLGAVAPAGLKPDSPRPKALGQAAIRVVFQITALCLDTLRALAQGTSVNEHLVLDAVASLWAEVGLKDTRDPGHGVTHQEHRG